MSAMAWLEQEGAICRESYEVKTYDCTPRKELSATALLRWSAELADVHLGFFELSYEQLNQMGMVFLLTAVEMRIQRMPAMREGGTVATWHRGTDRVRFLRDTELCDQQGNCLAACSCEWVLVDPVTHKLKRPSCLPELGRVPMRDLSLLGPMAAIRLPGEMNAAGERRVGYADLDYNGHLNNTKYADIISDWVPGGLGEGYFTRLRIDFQGEAKQGDVLSISTGVEAQSKYIRAVHNRGKCFTAVCEIREGSQ